MDGFFSDFIAQIGATSPLEWVAVALALGYVLLAAKQNSWCWLCALISTGIYTWLFWQVTLPFQAALNVFYMAMAGYGYYQWSKRSTPDGQGKPVRSWALWIHSLIVPLMIILAWALSKVAGSQFISDYLLLDASINLLSVIATFMVAHKILQNWVYWFFINLASAYLYLQVGYALSACLFLGYVGFSIFGYNQWFRQWKAQDDRRTTSSAVTEGA